MAKPVFSNAYALFFCGCWGLFWLFSRRWFRFFLPELFFWQQIIVRLMHFAIVCRLARLVAVTGYVTKSFEQFVEHSVEFLNQVVAATRCAKLEKLRRTVVEQGIHPEEKRGIRKKASIDQRTVPEFLHQTLLHVQHLAFHFIHTRHVLASKARRKCA